MKSLRENVRGVAKATWQKPLYPVTKKMMMVIYSDILQGSRVYIKSREDLQTQVIARVEQCSDMSTNSSLHRYR
nr:hypothetical protein [Tanacetum cinerariifolium]